MMQVFLKALQHELSGFARTNEATMLRRARFANPPIILVDGQISLFENGRNSVPFPTARWRGCEHPREIGFFKVAWDQLASIAGPPSGNVENSS